MKIVRGALLVILVQAISAQQPASAWLDGIVTIGETNSPLARAVVQLRNASGLATTTTTDDAGRFFFPSNLPGEYRLAATRDGYVRAEYGQRHVGGAGLPITFSAGQRMSGVTIAMTPGGSISGRITDRGTPRPFANVFVVNMGYELGQRVSNNVLSAVTNDLGEYHIFWLPPGRYYVVTTIYDNVTRRPDVISLDGGNAPIETREATRFVLAKTISSGAISDTEKHVPFFFPATPNWDSAEPIDVLPGAELRDINIDVKTVPSLHIRGIVTGLPPSSRNATAPAAGGIVLLLPQSPALTAFWPDFDQGRTNPDGSFDFSNVSPGLYTLSACQPGCPPVGRVSVEVRDRDVNVTVPLLDSFSVSGRVAIEGGPNPDPRLAALGITLQLDPPLGGFRQNMSAPTATQAGFINPVVHPAADGSFVIRSGLGVLLSGDYRVIVHPALLPQIGGTQPPINLPPGLQAPPPKGLENIYVKSIRMGDRDVLNDGLHLTDQPRDPVLIVIGTNSGALEGRVLDGRHQPVAAATVVLIPESGLRFHINHKNTTTNADGRFQLAAIPPGDYKVFAWEAAETNAWQDPDFVRRYESSATRVHIDEGAKLSLELPSIP